MKRKWQLRITGAIAIIGFITIYTGCAHNQVGFPVSDQRTPVNWDAGPMAEVIFDNIMGVLESNLHYYGNFLVLFETHPRLGAAAISDIFNPAVTGSNFTNEIRVTTWEQIGTLGFGTRAVGVTVGMGFNYFGIHFAFSYIPIVPIRSRYAAHFGLRTDGPAHGSMQVNFTTVEENDYAFEAAVYNVLNRAFLALAGFTPRYENDILRYETDMHWLERLKLHFQVKR